MPWTKQQQKVIDQRDADILVSAAAGSGKTAVLVERIIQKITDEKHPIDVDHLLVVTFTKAAAGEMKERIMAALDEKVREFPGNQHFVKQLSLIHKAQITTIHSFCMNLIRDYFYVLGIDRKSGGCRLSDTVFIHVQIENNVSFRGDLRRLFVVVLRQVGEQQLGDRDAFGFGLLLDDADLQGLLRGHAATAWAAAGARSAASKRSRILRDCTPPASMAWASSRSCGASCCRCPSLHWLPLACSSRSACGTSICTSSFTSPTPTGRTSRSRSAP